MFSSLVRTAAAPTVIQMTTICPACGAPPGRACASLVAWPDVDFNLTLKPSHYARRAAYFLVRGEPNPDVLQSRPDLDPELAP